jgi:ABC-2 type transport system permease protein
MLAKIAAFEARYQLRSPLFIVAFALFFFMTFGAVTNEHIRIGAPGNTNLNSPYAIVQTVSTMGVFGLFVLVAFVANVVLRDDETGFASIIRATRITKFDYLFGRFIGAYGVALLVMASVPLAMLVGSWMPWLDAEKVGPTVISHYLYAVLVVSAPTMLVLGAGFFALATVTRSMMWTYVGVIAFLVLFVVSRNLLKEPSQLTIAALTDPFGLTTFREVTRYWTTTERNSQLPAVSGTLLANRAIWVCVAMGFLALTYWLFRFDAHSKQRAKEKISEQHDASPIITSIAVASTGAPSAWRQFVVLAKFDMRFVFKSPAFFVLLALGVLNSVGGLSDTTESLDTHFFPVTRAVVESLLGSFSFLAVVIAIYYAGELVWRDRDRRMHEIVDATSAPNWAFLVPKIMGISLVLLSCFVAAALTGCVFQLANGYTHFQLDSYLLWFVMPELISAILFAIIAVFVQTLSPHKAVGWAIMLMYVVSTFALDGAGFEHNLYNYAGAPQVPLSDMNGMGRFWIGHAWFQAYWLAFGILLLVGAQLLWPRGVDTSVLPRLRRMRERFVGVPRAIAIVATVSWIGMGAYIFYNTNILNEYRTKPEAEEWAANFEKTLLPFEKLPQPRVVDVQLNVNIEPHAVRVTTTGSYTIENRTGAPLKEMHVYWARPLKMQSLTIDGAQMTKEYAEFDYRIYTFTTPMQPAEKRALQFRSVLEQKGFANSGNLTRIVESGTFLNNMEIAPFIGMDRGALLSDRSKRRNHGLPADLRPAKLEDAAANAHNYLRHDSDFVTAQIQVTTDADQTPIAPGYTVSDTISGNRRTLVTKTDAPISHFFSIQSARYAVRKDIWTNGKDQPVDLAVYYYPEHDRNVDRMLAAMKASLSLFSEQFSPYQFHQARILEFPAYERFAQSFANTIPFSESIGFIQNHDDAKNDEEVDLVTYVTAHEIGHQWWAHQLIGADKQGMTMLSESFAQYSALLVMEKLYGKEQIRKFLKSELDRYLRNRGAEVVEELPLARVENQQHIHYSKGSLSMYWLKEVVGEDVVNRALRNLLTEFAFKPAPYPSSTDFLRLLRAEAGPEHDELIADLFEKITLYDMKASNAIAKKLADGKYQVAFTVEGKKLYADGQGKETEAALNEPFDIGVFTVEPGKKGYTRESVIRMQRRSMQSGKQTIEFVVDQVPKFVGVDPYNKRIDRNSDDNLTQVTMD